MRIEAERGGILAGQLDEIGAAGAALFADALELAGRVFHADDIVQFRQFAHGHGGHVDDRASRNVVDDNRNADFVQHGVMRDQAGLGRLVVIRSDHQSRVGADILGVLHEAKRFDGVVRSGPGDHRNAAGGRFDDHADDVFMLQMAQRRTLARGADRNQPVRAFGDLPLHQILEGRIVHLAVFHRRDERWHRSLKHWIPSLKW